MFMREEKMFYSVSQGCFESWHFLNLSWKFKLHLETDKDSFRYLKKKKKEDIIIQYHDMQIYTY